MIYPVDSVIHLSFRKLWDSAQLFQNLAREKTNTNTHSRVLVQEQHGPKKWFGKLSMVEILIIVDWTYEYHG